MFGKESYVPFWVFIENKTKYIWFKWHHFYRAVSNASLQKLWKITVALMENSSKDPRKSTPFFFLWGLVIDTFTVAAKTLIPQRETGMEHN